MEASASAWIQERRWRFRHLDLCRECQPTASTATATATPNRKGTATPWRGTEGHTPSSSCPSVTISQCLEDDYYGEVGSAPARM